MRFNSVEHSCDSLTQQSRAYSTGMEARPIKLTAHWSKWLLERVCLRIHFSSHQRCTMTNFPNSPKWTVFLRLQSKTSTCFSSPHLSYLEIGQCREPSSGRLAWQNSPFSHPPLQGAARLRWSSLQVLPVGWSSTGDPKKSPVANGENEWFGFLGGWGSYYKQTSRILFGRFWMAEYSHT